MTAVDKYVVLIVFLAVADEDLSAEVPSTRDGGECRIRDQG
jgi:hypothetical protein